ncbi:MAG: hypothetical protein LBB62_05105 [Proteiniphilum sp.]|nr:hypothetical protein [Proteiniphilum sp.]
METKTITNEMKEKDTDFSFERGWYQLKQRDVKEVRVKIMSALCITTRMAFLDRMKGKYIPKVTEAKAIEGIFADYGIKDVWGAA